MYFDVGPQGDKVSEDLVTVRPLPWELMNAALMHFQCLTIRTFKVTATTLKVNVAAELLPAGVQEGGGRKAH